VSAVGISRSPLREWHAFATVSTPGRSGYRLLVSRAGDWTSRFIDDPPSHLWVRGDVQVAVDACRASAAGHTFFGVTPNGVAAVVTTAGNPDTHVILRGGRSGPNYEASHIAKALDLLVGAGLPGLP
jgi:hypothetical protein